MKPVPFILVIAALFSASSAFAQTNAPAAPASANGSVTPVKLPPQAPDVAAVKMRPDGQPDAEFLKHHESLVAIAKQGKAELVFLGDSITAGWESQKPIWDKAFGPYKPTNFGISGDRTQHVLWRIENGELEGFKPKVAVVMIGTNNLGADLAEGIAKGIAEIVKTIRQKSPSTKVLLLGVLPNGEKPSPVREKIQQVNAIIAQLADGKQVVFLDIGSRFLQTGGVLRKEVTTDFVHLSSTGYQIWADAITPELAELFR